jgi:hypothetical protein
MSVFGPIHLQHWYPNYPNLDIYIYIYIYILDVKSNVNIRADPFATLVPKLPKSGYIYILDVKSNVNIRTDPFATLVPKLPTSGYIYIFWMLNPMSIFRPIHLQHWYPNYPNLGIYILDVKSNANIRTDPFATLVPNYPNLDIYIFWLLNLMSIFGPIHLQHWYPN